MIKQKPKNYHSKKFVQKKTKTQTLKKTVYTPMHIQTTVNELSGLEKREHMK